MSADDAFGLLVRLSQHTDTKLAEFAVAFVARARDRGPAGPRCCRVVTDVVKELLSAAGPGVSTAGPVRPPPADPH